MRTLLIKYILVAGFFFLFPNLHAQNLSFDHGKIEFYTATIITDIEAISEKAEVRLNLETGQVEVSVNIKSFEFENDLMQEHFNEKYMESDKFPNATFKGKILQDISGGIKNETEVDAAGDLTIHGVTMDIKFKVNLSRQGEFTVVKTKIPVVFKDYNIDDPSILSKSVAKDVAVVSTLFLKEV